MGIGFHVPDLLKPENYISILKTFTMEYEDCTVCQKAEAVGSLLRQEDGTGVAVDAFWKELSYDHIPYRPLPIVFTFLGTGRKSTSRTSSTNSLHNLSPLIG